MSAYIAAGRKGIGHVANHHVFLLPTAMRTLDRDILHNTEDQFWPLEKMNNIARTEHITKLIQRAKLFEFRQFSERSSFWKKQYLLAENINLEFQTSFGPI